MKDRCPKCLYCDGSKLTQMVCLRYPPNVLMAPAGPTTISGQVKIQMLSQFPPVSENFGCGEFKENLFLLEAPRGA